MVRIWPVTNDAAELQQDERVRAYLGRLAAPASA